MTIKDVITSGGVLLVLMTLIQVTPIKVNPWSAIWRGIKKGMSAIGNALHGDIISKLDELREMQTKTKDRLDEHIRTDDERNADLHRIQILRFNRELMRGDPHTHEDFIEAMSEIDFYENYCKEHEEYKNNRAVLAIKNIKRVYMEWQENHEGA